MSPEVLRQGRCVAPHPTIVVSLRPYVGADWMGGAPKVPNRATMASGQIWAPLDGSAFGRVLDKSA
jgi:hypothetical protein